MKSIGTILSLIVLMVFSSCNKSDEANEYKFTQDYCATVTVGGIAGTEERCYNKKDIVKAESITDSSIIVRIAEHSELNENCPNSWCYQELLEIPIEYVKVNRTLF